MHTVTQLPDVLDKIVTWCTFATKRASYSDSLRKTTEELSGMGTSRHPKVLKSGPNHGCQWIFKLKKSRRHKTAHMAQKCHNIAIFLHSLAFLVTLLVVRTTVMLTLGSERTQTLVTHVGWWYGVIFTLPMNLAIWGQRGPKYGYFWSKSGLYGRLVLGLGSNLESVS